MIDFYLNPIFSIAFRCKLQNMNLISCALDRKIVPVVIVLHTREGLSYGEGVGVGKKKIFTPYPHPRSMICCSININIFH